MRDTSSCERECAGQEVCTSQVPTVRLDSLCTDSVENSRQEKKKFWTVHNMSYARAPAGDDARFVPSAIYEKPDGLLLHHKKC